MPGEASSHLFPATCFAELPVALAEPEGVQRRVGLKPLSLQLVRERRRGPPACTVDEVPYLPRICKVTALNRSPDIL